MVKQEERKLIDTSRVKPDEKPLRFRGSAMKRLRKATKRVVRDNSTAIAKALLDHALKGDVKSTNLLLTLIEEEPRSTSEENYFSVAEALMAEPPWQEPPDYTPDY
jgi:hypothetical protein